MAELQTDTTSTAARGTLTEQALESLQKDILAGTLKPGARLGVTELANTYDIGTTPIREALSRLLSKNLIVATERRGFRVREMSYDDLRDITLTRFVIEREALRLSMIQGDDEWIALIVASLHRLRLLVSRHSEEEGLRGTEFDELHQAFHSALISACKSPRLMGHAENLYLQAYRYRATMMDRWTDPQKFISAHEALAAAVTERRESEAIELLEDHLTTTLRHVFPEC